MTYTVYSTITGQILRIVNTINIDIQIGPNEAYLDGFIDDSLYYIENQQPVEFPPKPDKYSNFDWTTHQWVLDPVAAGNAVVEKRDVLLYKSDWTQIPNNPLTPEVQQQWAVYRQQLRDVTAQSGYPFNVVWPTPP
jgi:hypothetical protein